MCLLGLYANTTYEGRRESSNKSNIDNNKYHYRFFRNNTWNVSQSDTVSVPEFNIQHKEI